MAVLGLRWKLACVPHWLPHALCVHFLQPSTNGIVVRAGNVKLMGSTSAGSSPGSARIFVLGHGVKIKKNIFSSNPRRLSTL